MTTEPYRLTSVTQELAAQTFKPKPITVENTRLATSKPQDTRPTNMDSEPWNMDRRKLSGN